MRWLFFLLSFFPLFVLAQTENKINAGCEPFFDSAIQRSYYKYVSEEPAYPGGVDSLYKTLNRHIRFPERERCDFEGTVWVSFIVEPDGSISNIRLLKKVSLAYFNEEALRAASHLTNWIPGKCNGIAVPTLQYLPVRFRLQ